VRPALSRAERANFVRSRKRRFSATSGPRGRIPRQDGAGEPKSKKEKIMARKEIILEIQDREQTLTFRIREMPASKLESWIIRAVLLVAGSGAEVPAGADLKAVGLFLQSKGLTALGNVDFEKSRPLLDELLSCCSRVIERVEERCTPESVDAYIEDVKTLFTLRMEALKLNLGFFKGAVENLSGSPEKALSATP